MFNDFVNAIRKGAAKVVSTTGTALHLPEMGFSEAIGPTSSLSGGSGAKPAPFLIAFTKS